MFRTLALAAAPALFAASATAAPLVDFEFTVGGNIDEEIPFSGGGSSTAADVNLSTGLAAGSGFAPLNRFNSFNANQLIDGASQSGSLSEVIADQEFISFTTGAAAGKQLDLAGGSLDFDQLQALGNAANTAFDTINLFTSVDGFDASDVVSSTARTGGSADDSLDIPNDARFNALTGDVEFRVYFSRTTAATVGGGGFRLDASDGAGITLNGEVSDVPEPGSLVLAGLSGLALARRNRRA